VLLLLAAAGPVAAGFPLPEVSLPQRVALADLVFVGKVQTLEENLVEANPLLKVPGAGKVPFRMAVVRVDTVIVGPRKLDEARVGFVETGAPGTRFVGTPSGQAKLQAGQEGIFFVRKHPDEAFCVAAAAWNFLDRSQAKEFDVNVALVKRCAGLLQDPAAGLRSKDADHRLLTAAMLIFRYRTVQWVLQGPSRTEPIDAEQSKLLLSILAEGPLDEENPRLRLSRFKLFLRLGLTPADGWHPPRILKEVPAAAARWLQENGSMYRVQRFVPPEKN
jgi:hypothetical protein